MKKIIYFSNQYKRWLLLIPCLIVILIGWTHRVTLWGFVPIKDNFILYNFCKNIFYMSYFLISGVILAGMTQFINSPPLTRYKVNMAIMRVGLLNDIGEHPVLSSVRLDKNKTHGKIYILKNVGLSIDEFKNRAAQLEAALNLHFYSIKYGRTSRKVLLYAIPRKYDKPSRIALDSELAQEICRLPNLLCVGKTGSGKSYALSVLLGIYAKHIPNINITICDYKKSSFAQFEDTPNFYGYEDVPDGIRAFYKEFSERLQANDEKRNKQIRVLVVDEYGALISAQDRQTADELKQMIGNMLFMSRSLGLIIVLGVQRADAEYFKAGARDQFRAILAFGNISKEQKHMLFADCKDSMNELNKVGEGYLLVDGKSVERVQVEEVRDWSNLNDSIRKAMCR